MKLCKDCKHCELSEIRGNEKCHFVQATDFVYGLPFFAYCREVRSFPHLCNCDGDWFDPIYPAVVPKPKPTILQTIINFFMGKS